MICAVDFSSSPFAWFALTLILLIFPGLIIDEFHNVELL